MNEEVKELYPGHAEEARRHQERVQRIGAAAATPLPGPLLEAYAHVPQTIAGLTVRPVVHYDFVILQKLGSPLLAHLSGKDAVPTPFSDEQGYEIVYQFTRPVREVAALALRDPEEFRRRAVEELGMTLGLAECNLLIKAVERELVRAFLTVVGYEQRRETQGAVFTQPPAETTTASAGGSTTSRGWCGTIISRVRKCFTNCRVALAGR